MAVLIKTSNARRRSYGPVFSSGPSLLRSARADGFFTSYRNALRKELNRQVEEAAQRARNGLEPIPFDLQDRWQRRLFDIMLPFYDRMTVAGMRAAEDEQAVSKSFPLLAGIYNRSRFYSGQKRKLFIQMQMRHFWAIDLAGKQDAAIGAVNMFDAQPDFTVIRNWVGTVSTVTAESNKLRLNLIFQEASGKLDANGIGASPRDIAKEIRSKGLAFTKHRSTMLARTGTIWAYNEGAVQTYQQSGVTAVTWLATDDDVTCPFCRAMHGKSIRSNDAFWTGGQTFGVQSGGNLKSLKLPFPVRHPPLHPYCRCTVVPALTTEQVPPLPAAENVAPEDTGSPEIAPPIPTTLPAATPTQVGEVIAPIETEAVTTAAAQETAEVTSEQIRNDLINQSRDSSRRIEQLEREQKQLTEEINQMMRELTERRRIRPGSNLTPEEVTRAKEIQTRSLTIDNQIDIVGKQARQETADIMKVENPLQLGQDVRSPWKRKNPKMDIAQRNINDATEWLKSITDSSVLNSSKELVPGESVHPRGIVYHMKKGRIRSSVQRLGPELGVENRMRSIVHEVAHHIENNDPEIRQAVRNFYKKRTKGNLAQPLSDVTGTDYGKDELTKIDKWDNPYTGKLYLDENGDQFATEIMSTGVEDMFTNAAGFAQRDPEYFNFVLDMLQGRVSKWL